MVTEGFAASLTEAATRFAMSEPAVGTILVGMAAPQQFEDALAAGPFLAGGELSLAEIVMGTLVYRWHAFPIERPPLRRLKSWYERTRERPAFKTHIEIPIT